MPELPEVEVVKRGLDPLLRERVIEQCSFSGKPLRLPLQRSLFKAWVSGANVVEVRRRAKYIIICLGNGAKLIIHLGMTGKLGLFPLRVARKVHDHAWFSLDNGMELRFNDVRRFGSLQVFIPEDNAESIFKHLGPEPLSRAFSAAYLAKKAKNRTQPVKNFLMDARVVAGIGNIYANEILYESEVRPDTPSRKISDVQWKTIVSRTRSVLKRAIAAGGSTIADFVGSSGEKGYFQLQLKVYGRKGLPCPACGRAISKTVMAGRATYFCETCQK